MLEGEEVDEDGLDAKSFNLWRKINDSKERKS